MEKEITFPQVIADIERRIEALPPAEEPFRRSRAYAIQLSIHRSDLFAILENVQTAALALGSEPLKGDRS